MTEIIKTETIIKNELSNNNYLESLLKASLKYKYITEEEYQIIIAKLLNLLSITIKKYTGELTSSVQLNIAKNINISNMWTISLFLKNKTISESIKILLNEEINNIYKYGYKELLTLINKTKLFYNTIFINNLLDNNNYFYTSTLISGIKGFFKIYNSSYKSHELPITIDYNPCLSRPNLYGIEFIKEYLKYINYENIFCKNFSSIKIKTLLKRLHSKYKELPINIFEYLLTITILLEYQKQDIFLLNISNVNVNVLYNDYKINKIKYLDNLKKSYKIIKSKVNLNLESLEYIDKCSTIIINTIILHTKNKTLDVLLGTNKKEEIIYKINKKMSNKDYNNLLKLSKEDLINKVDSLFDLIDILEDIEFTKEELIKIFNNLSTMEIMVLKKYYFDNPNTHINNELNSYIMTKSIKEQEIINNNYKYLIYE